MAAAGRLIGTNIVIEWLLTGGTPDMDEKVLTSDFTTFSFNRQFDTVDVTAGNETVRFPKTTIEAADFSLMLFDANQAYAADILPGDTGKLSVYPEGKTTGKPTFSFNAILTQYSEDFPFDGVLEIDISGERQGGMIDEIGSTVP